MSNDDVIMCNHCKAIYRFEPSLCDCIVGTQEASYSKWRLVPKLPTVAILNAAMRVKVKSGYDGMDEPTYTNLSEAEARDVYARMLAAVNAN